MSWPVTLTTSAARVEAMQKAAHDLVVKPLRLPAGIFLFGIQATLRDSFYNRLSFRLLTRANDVTLAKTNLMRRT